MRNLNRGKKQIINLGTSAPQHGQSGMFACSGCGNLLQNPSFEAGLTGWEADNVFAANRSSFEGTQAAVLGATAGVASLFQDVRLPNENRFPLFLSFNVFPFESASFGIMTAEVLWLDGNGDTIGTGLSLYIPGGQINSEGRLTYYGVTDRPPNRAAGARLRFSKGTIETPFPATDRVEIDLVTLAPIGSINLLFNPGFEAGITGWTTLGYDVRFREIFEGAAKAQTSTAGSSLQQDVPLNSIPACSSFLLSFAAFSTTPSTFRAQVLWLNSTGTQIGMPGLSLLVGNALAGHGNYYTYLALTGPAPAGAATARVLFTADGTDVSVSIDSVILARVTTPNLVRNPGFEDGLSEWEFVDVTAVMTEQAYEGTQVARIAIPGGVLTQTIPLGGGAGHCFLLNFGVGYTPEDEPVSPGELLAKVIWLDGAGREIGPGLSLVIPETEIAEAQWFVYSAVTEPAPPGTAAARIQFTKGGAEEVNAFIVIDLVEFGRLV